MADQFEEAFTLCRDAAEAGASSSGSGGDGGRRVVLTMRADFWGECAPYPALREAMQDHQELVPPMDAAELRSAIEQQAAKVGLRFEAGLAATILATSKGSRGPCPCFSTRCWRSGSSATGFGCGRRSTSSWAASRGRSPPPPTRCGKT